MTPIKVAILWHFHQPYYKKDDEFILPWVRFHGVKDYWDLPELFHDYPGLKQTINLVPSMQMQVEEYVSRKTSDYIQRLTTIKAIDLSIENKMEILRLFFLCNIDNMIKPYPRYNELYEQSRNAEDAIKNFVERDWLDLQVWYNLTWFGQLSRKRLAVNRLFKKGKDFSEAEKKIVLNMHLDILGQLVPQLNMLKDMGQIEVSISPMYHPILPLLCDSESALETKPDAKMPSNIFSYSQDARTQIEMALEYSKTLLGAKSYGMWPSEGSISNETLGIATDCGVKWIASDEKVLANSVGEKYYYLDKYFPRKIKTQSGYITGLFRDLQLSDAIGFVYSRWNHFDAVNDFMHRLRHIRSELINKYGEECLEHAVVPIILDGENCWEFYNNNGEQFLREFFHQLEDMKDFETVTCSEATADEHLNYLPEVENIKAGSWINGDFNIWIGHEEHRTAWSMLADIRQLIEDEKKNLSEEQLRKAMQEIYIAEGSDWFWWYGDSHQADNKSDFDLLFRLHLEEAYKAIGETPPEELGTPISEQSEKIEFIEQSGDIDPEINGIIALEDEWEKAGCYEAASSMGAMHQIGELLNRFWFASANGKIYFRFDFKNELQNNDSISLKIQTPVNAEFIFTSQGISYASEKSICNLEYAYKDVLEISFDRLLVSNDTDNKIQLEIILKTKTNEGEIYYPRQGSLGLEL